MTILLLIQNWNTRFVTASINHASTSKNKHATRKLSPTAVELTFHLLADTGFYAINHDPVQFSRRGSGRSDVLGNGNARLCRSTRVSRKRPSWKTRRCDRVRPATLSSGKRFIKSPSFLAGLAPSETQRETIDSIATKTRNKNRPIKRVPLNYLRWKLLTGQCLTTVAWQCAGAPVTSRHEY